ncbi:Yip1 domain-containing protein [Loktanella sp. DSM 29012]|uniref:YIP1 family protein n=1 Tax=Loktanella gaetbuli TaxID=2881335 RepID=A0ABS8BQJ6_9RHOB|nr:MULTISPECIES: YIP1 family protein [Loktanella]MCB5197997.1 YIP1 family protein [Loktanella gaetbuli]SEQ21976.1 Yip1 domain-containing protein [Loktanella sp. DSM 29012]
MAVSTNIMRAWRRPRQVMRELLDQGKREDRAIAYLFVFCILVFIAQWPRLSRRAAGFELAPGAEPPELSQLMTYELFAWLMVWPLVLYGLAALSHLVARLFGGQGSFYSARLALFWSLLASVPLLLLYGLMAGFLGPAAGTQLVGAVWLLIFGYIWLQSLREAEK